jgi:ribonuclease HI
MDCKNGSATKPTSKQSASTMESDPSSGVFTDGSSAPNPGPGGWGAVYVHDNKIIAEAFGHGGETTNNRMELLALIQAVDLVPDGTSVRVYSDSKLAVQTITEWAAGWEKRGWKRKSGPVENLDLVKEAFAAFKKRPELDLKWIKAHVGFRWNEYADELANKGRLEP